MPASFLMGLALLLTGCGSDIPSSTVTTGLTLDCQVFQNPLTGVNRIFDLNIGGRTCSASGCHSPTSAGGAFKIFPNAAPNTVEMQANYYAAIGSSNLGTPTNSKLLLEPLAGSQPSVGGHGGGDIFLTGGEPEYATILTWIATQIQGPSSCFP